MLIRLLQYTVPEGKVAGKDEIMAEFTILEQERPEVILWGDQAWCFSFTKVEPSKKDQQVNLKIHAYRTRTYLNLTDAANEYVPE